MHFDTPLAPITLRPFAGPEDFEAMVACANASFAADGTGFFRTVEDVARDYASFTSCVPERDVWITDTGSEIAGYVRSWPWAQADGLQLYSQFAVVAPQWRKEPVYDLFRAAQAPCRDGMQGAVCS